MRPDNNARAAAEREGVDIKLYRIIYEAVDDVRAALEGMLRPEEREVVLGEAEVREVFKISKIGTIAGCSVRSGVINRQGRVRVDPRRRRGLRRHARRRSSASRTTCGKFAKASSAVSASRTSTTSRSATSSSAIAPKERSRARSTSRRQP